jgi:hypothetical protein
VYRCCQAWRQENGFQAEKTRNFKGQLAGRATIDRRRPSSGGEKTTMLVSYRIRKESWCATHDPPCLGQMWQQILYPYILKNF